MVIVGAGECGTRAAFALREEGFTGAITLIGAEPHLPYERPPLSKEMLAVGAPAEPRHISGREKFTEAKIDLVTSAEAMSIDRERKTVLLRDGSSHAYEKLLLATGALPRRLPMAEASRRCFYLRSCDDAGAIRARLLPNCRVVVIGGGFIGLELAAAAGKRGCVVTVIEAQSRILMRGVPAAISEVIHSAHLAQGVEIGCGMAIATIEEIDDSLHIGLANGRRIEADVCIVGVGAVPNTMLAEAAGLEIENGICAAGTLVTSDPNIYAAGDCCSFPLDLYRGRRVRLEAWRNAQDQAKLAARNMLGAGASHDAVPWFWSDQYDRTLQIAGLIDEGVETVRRDIGEDTFILFHLAEDGRLVAASGIGPGTAVARDIRLAEMLIARRAYPPREKLAAPDSKLKALLAA
jgi:3-phenylpropionate/trans-cinnamate dioxygenase ferredoxin reductase component